MMTRAQARLRWPTVDGEDPLPGLGERVTHPEFAGVEFLHVRAKSLLNHVPEAASLPFRWTINTYRGCTHACTYCFARPSHRWLELDPATEFESVIVVKVNAVERLRAELRAPRWRGEAVALGTNTDPYQRAEGRYRLTRGVITTLTEAANPFSVLTKGTLVLRDLDVLTEAARAGVCTSVALSIPTVDDTVWRVTEPGTPHPRRRLETVAALAEAGVPTGVFLAPVIPGLSDGVDQLRAVIEEAVAAGADSVTAIPLHLRPGVREVFLERLAEHDPEQAAALAATYRGAYAPRSERRRIAATVDRLLADTGGPRRSARIHSRDARRSDARAVAPPAHREPEPATRHTPRAGEDASGPPTTPPGAGEPPNVQLRLL